MTSGGGSGSDRPAPGPMTRPEPRYFHESAGAVVFVDERIVALRRGDRDEWVLPKGHLERDESPEDAAVREVREETGLEIQIIAPIGATRYAFGEGHAHRKRVHWFVARWIGGTMAVEPVFAEARLIDLQAAVHLLTHAADRELVARAYAIVEADLAPPSEGSDRGG